MSRDRLIHHFTPMLLRIIAIAQSVRAASTAGSPPPSCRAAEDDLRSTLDRCRKAARDQAGKHAGEVEDVAYATVAFADDLFPSRRLNYWWRGEPLQRSLFDQRTAGDEFFDRVRRFTDTHGELREAYLTVIGLGFRGRYHDEQRPEDLVTVRRQLDDIVAPLAARLTPPPIPPQSFADPDGDYLTPQPYKVKQPNLPIIPKQFPWLAAGGLAALLLLAALTGLYFAYFGGGGGGTAGGAVTAKPTIDAQAKGIIADITCSKLTVAGVSGEGVLSLGGRQGDPAGYEERLKRLRDIPGVKSVDTTKVQYIPRPFCSVLDIVDQNATTTLATVPKITLNKPDGKYTVGDVFYFDLAAAQDFKGYLTAFYVQSDLVATLLPSASNPEDALGARQTVRVGRPRNEWTAAVPGWEIDGTDEMALVVALVTQQPLWKRDDATNPHSVFGGKLKDALASMPAMGEPGANVHALAATVLLSITPPPATKP